MVFKPDYKDGKDAYLRSLSPDVNYGDHKDCAAHAWTNSGDEVIVRCLIDFDLDGLPENIEVTGAYLSLYVYNSHNGEHSSLSDSKTAILSRVTEDWEEGRRVTWNNQPAVTAENEVYLAQSQYEGQDYIDIDVSNLVLDMLDDPTGSFGFQIRLVEESYYRRMVFASSDVLNPALHPELRITYNLIEEEEEDISTIDTLTSVFIEEDVVSLYPNPVADILNIEGVDRINEVAIYNSIGQKLRVQMIDKKSIDLSSLQNGVFVIVLISEDKSFQQTIVKQ